MRGFGGGFPTEDSSSAGLCTVLWLPGAPASGTPRGSGVSDAQSRRPGSCVACQHTACERFRFYTGCVIGPVTSTCPAHRWLRVERGETV